MSHAELMASLGGGGGHAKVYEEEPPSLVGPRRDKPAGPLPGTISSRRGSMRDDFTEGVFMATQENVTAADYHRKLKHGYGNKAPEIDVNCQQISDRLDEQMTISDGDFNRPRMYGNGIDHLAPQIDADFPQIVAAREAMELISEVSAIDSRQHKGNIGFDGRLADASVFDRLPDKPDDFFEKEGVSIQNVLDNSLNHMTPAYTKARDDLVYEGELPEVPNVFDDLHELESTYGTGAAAERARRNAYEIMKANKNAPPRAPSPEPEPELATAKKTKQPKKTWTVGVSYRKEYTDNLEPDLVHQIPESLSNMYRTGKAEAPKKLSSPFHGES